MDFRMPMPDFTLDPAADAEEKLRQALGGNLRLGASALPRSRRASVGGTLTNSTTSTDELGSGRAMLAQALKMYGENPDITALNEFAAKRAKDGDSSMLNALAAQFAGEGFEPVQAQFLKRAAAAEDPMKFGNYGYATGGKFVADPYAARDKSASAMMDVGGKLLDNEEAAARDERISRDNAAREERLARSNQTSRLQQSDTFALPDGRIVKGMFDPSAGYVYSTPQGMRPVPADARPVTPSTAAPLSTTNFNKLVSDVGTEKAALFKLKQYEDNIGDANVGLQRWADQVAVKAKTLFGSEQITPKQLAAMEGPAKLQALLGMFRVDIVGPGVMTEYDAARVVQALGGNFDALQNPTVVRSILQDIRANKERRIAEMERQVEFSNKFFPGVYYPNQYNYEPGPSPTPADEFGTPPSGAVRRK
jgi:hypothetical protein